MRKIPECLAAAPPRPMGSCPFDVVSGAAPNSPILIALPLLGLGAVWYYVTYTSAPRDMRDMALAVGAGFGLLLLLFVLRWIILIMGARALFRDGVLVDAEVKQVVTVRQRKVGAQYGGTILHFNAVVAFVDPSGSRRTAYFTMVNRKLFDTVPILVATKGRRVGLYLEPFMLTPQIKVPSLFRMTKSRAA